MKTYPICLINLLHRRVIVIGGGQVALRKVRGLLDAEASVLLISPTVDEELECLSQNANLRIKLRDYQKGDLQGAFLVIAATDNVKINQAVWEEAQQEGCLINVVDDPSRCNFILPALVRRGDFTLSVSTGGCSPALARRIREKLENEYGPEYGEFAAILGEIREELLSGCPPGQARLNVALKLIDSDLMDVLISEGYDQAKGYALEMLTKHGTQQ